MDPKNPFVPALFTCFKEGYNFKTLRSDFIAGLTVAIVALPLAMAMAVASGASPDKGLVTAVVAGFFISFLGGSRVQIGGPTGAFVVVIFNVIAEHGFSGLILSSIMAGIILIISGYMKLGKLIKYIPYPVITGFTTGIALTIASTQVKDFLGLTYENVPAEFLAKWLSYFEHLHEITPEALAIGLGSLLIIIISKKISAKIPAYLVAVVAASLVATLAGLNVETIGTRFPNLPTGLPPLIVPEISYELIQDLIPTSFTIAFLAGIEALLSAVVADSMTGHKHSLNQELVGQGVANIASGLFGGLPATGAIARTATNIKSGGKTPMSGIFHALVLLVFMYTLMEILAFIPMSALAAVLFMVAFGMSDLKHFTQILKISASDRTILLFTFALTVLVDLTVAIAVGVTFASLLFMRHMSKSLEIRPHSLISEYDHQDGDITESYEIPDGLAVLQINGPLFFGVASELCEKLKSMDEMPTILILRMRFMPYLDASGEAALEEIADVCEKEKTFLIFSGIRSQPRSILERAKIPKRVDCAFTLDFKQALEMAIELLHTKDFLAQHHEVVHHK